MSNILDVLLQKKPVVCDGAMGTMLYALGAEAGQCVDDLCLSRPDLVRQVHRDYVDAGAEIIETNTFGANRVMLESHGLAGKAREINLAGVSLAKESAAGKAYVGGSVGPTGKLMAPYGPLAVEDAASVFEEQIEVLAEGGVDLIFIETMADITEIGAALGAAKKVAPDIPVICQMSFAQEGRTMMGLDPAGAAKALEDLGADVVGANCGAGPHDMWEVVRQMIQAASKPVIAQPNAGFPQFLHGRLVYMANPAYMAEYAKRFVEAGVAFVGGCCGTTPEHTRAIRAAVKG
ncbi:MAG: homocysteine S-methyltransferase family protein [Armatimonadota bacterium]|nr:homocysteine S-methyltransferase family protein [Armatimonadota bacterium]